MNKNRLERTLPIAGIAFAALLVIAAAAFPAPAGDDSPARHPAWLANHQAAVAVQGYIRAIAALAFAALALAVAHTIRDRVGQRSLAARIALVGGTLYGGALLLAQGAGIAAVIASHEHAGPQAVSALGFLEDGLLAVSSLPAIGLFAAAGARFLSDRLVPRWLAWLTLAGVPLALLDAASFSGSPFEPVGIIGLAYFLIWALATGTALLRRSANEPRQAGLAAGLADA
ncbi:MAG TPA: hypothetical protein VJU60_06050 [Thermoleophilaceae bacterium]|nr:hypothetical protein [Thermoleophilaceae bacterium]